MSKEDVKKEVDQLLEILYKQLDILEGRVPTSNEEIVKGNLPILAKRTKTVLEHIKEFRIKQKRRKNRHKA